jgi:hypothetical protein
MLSYMYFAYLVFSIQMSVTIKKNIYIYIYIYNFNISGFHIVVLFNLSKEMVYIPSNTTK